MHSGVTTPTILYPTKFLTPSLSLNLSEITILLFLLHINRLVVLICEIGFNFTKF